jgi:hypothetical protein
VPDAETISTSAFVLVAVILCVIGICISLFLMGYLFKYRNTRVIRQTSPLFVQVILIGIIFVFTSQIVWALQPTQFTCIFKVWLAAVGFGLIMGCYALNEGI